MEPAVAETAPMDETETGMETTETGQEKKESCSRSQAREEEKKKSPRRKRGQTCPGKRTRTTERNSAAWPSFSRVCQHEFGSSLKRIKHACGLVCPKR